MKEFWENDSILCAEGIKQMDLITKDESGGQGHAHQRKDPERYFPTKVRITVVQVSAGSKYDPSLVSDLPRGDGTKPAEGSAKPAEGPGCCASPPFDPSEMPRHRPRLAAEGASP